MTKGKWLGITGFGAVLAAATLLAGLFWSSKSNTSALVNKPPSGSAAAVQSLVVNPSKVATDYCAKLVSQYGGQLATLSDGSKTPVFDVGAEHPVTSSDPTVVVKLWTKAVNTPLVTQTVGAEQADICSDPAQAAMVMNGVGSQSINSTTVASQNSWMVAQGSPDAIAQWAQGCMVNDEPTHIQCAKIMSYTATLVGLFHDAGVQVASSTWNYDLVIGLAVGHVPAFELNPTQEANAHWLTIQVTSKTGPPLLCLGFNVGTTTNNGGDQRLAGLPCSMPSPTPTPTPTPTPGHTFIPPSHPPTPGHTFIPPSHTPCPCTSTQQVQIPPATQNPGINTGPIGSTVEPSPTPTTPLPSPTGSVDGSLGGDNNGAGPTPQPSPSITNVFP